MMIFLARCFIVNAGQDAPPTIGCGVVTGPSTPDESGNYNLKCVTSKLYHFKRLFGGKIALKFVRGIEKLTYRNHAWRNLSDSIFARLHTITKQSTALHRRLKQKYCCRVKSQQDALIFVDRKTKNGYNGLRRLFKVSGESPDVVHLL